MYWGTEFNAVTVLLRNILWFVPLGVFLGRAARLAADTKDGPRQQRRYVWLFLGCVLGLVLAIEAFQVCLVSRVPDLTDVVLYLCGAGLGFVLSRNGTSWVCIRLVGLAVRTICRRRVRTVNGRSWSFRCAT